MQLYAETHPECEDPLDWDPFEPIHPPSRGASLISSRPLDHELRDVMAIIGTPLKEAAAGSDVGMSETLGLVEGRKQHGPQEELNGALDGVEGLRFVT